MTDDSIASNDGGVFGACLIDELILIELSSLNNPVYTGSVANPKLMQLSLANCMKFLVLSKKALVSWHKFIASHLVMMMAKRVRGYQLRKCIELIVQTPHVWQSIMACASQQHERSLFEITCDFAKSQCKQLSTIARTCSDLDCITESRRTFTNVSRTEQQFFALAGEATADYIGLYPSGDAAKIFAAKHDNTRNTQLELYVTSNQLVAATVNDSLFDAAFASDVRYTLHSKRYGTGRALAIPPQPFAETHTVADALSFLHNAIWRNDWFRANECNFSFSLPKELFASKLLVGNMKQCFRESPELVYNAILATYGTSERSLRTNCVVVFYQLVALLLPNTNAAKFELRIDRNCTGNLISQHTFESLPSSKVLLEQMRNANKHRCELQISFGIKLSDVGVMAASDCVLHGYSFETHTIITSAIELHTLDLLKAMCTSAENRLVTNQHWCATAVGHQRSVVFRTKNLKGKVEFISDSDFSLGINPQHMLTLRKELVTQNIIHLEDNTCCEGVFFVFGANKNEIMICVRKCDATEAAEPITENKRKPNMHCAENISDRAIVVARIFVNTLAIRPLRQLFNIEYTAEAFVYDSTASSDVALLSCKASEMLSCAKYFYTFSSTLSSVLICRNTFDSLIQHAAAIGAIKRIKL